MHFKCPNCGSPISVAESLHPGSIVECALCGKSSNVPQLPPPIPAEVAGAEGGLQKANPFLPKHIRARDLDLSFPTMFLIKPSVSKAKAGRIVQARMLRYGRSWMRKLGAKNLDSSLECIYIPFWVVGGECNNRWTAQVGREKKVQGPCGVCGGTGRWRPGKSCSHCGGSGRAASWETEWSSEEGVVGVNAIELRLNVPKQAVHLKVKHPTMNPSLDEFGEAAQGDELVVPPLATSQDAGVQLGTEMLEQRIMAEIKKSILSRGSQGRDVWTGRFNFENLHAQHYLHPVWFGGYQYRGKSYGFQVDGISGEVGLDVPAAARFERWLSVGMISVVLVGLLALALRLVASSVVELNEASTPLKDRSEEVDTATGAEPGSLKPAGVGGSTLAASKPTGLLEISESIPVDQSLADVIILFIRDRESALDKLSDLSSDYPGSRHVSQVQDFLEDVGMERLSWTSAQQHHESSRAEAGRLQASAESASELSSQSIAGLPEHMRPGFKLKEASTLMEEADQTLALARQQWETVLNRGEQLVRLLENNEFPLASEALAEVLGQTRNYTGVVGTLLSVNLDAVEVTLVGKELTELTAMTDLGIPKTYQNVRVLKVEPDAIRIMHASGATRIRFEQLPEDLRERWGLKSLSK